MTLPCGDAPVDSPRCRVLLVDDSPIMRAYLRDLIKALNGFEVVGEAADGEAALQAAAALKPDLVTLDVEMPGLSGLETIDGLMEIAPTRVIMVSAHTRRHAEVTLDALQRGALDYVAKPTVDRGSDAFATELAAKLRMMAAADVRRILRIRRSKGRSLPRRDGDTDDQRRRPPQRATSDQLRPGCIAIGVSTGGPPALAAVFSCLRPPMPPMVVVQHMPADFTGPFARRLDSISALSIREAADGDRLAVNEVLLAPGGRHLVLERRGSIVCASINDEPPESSHRPSIDKLMRSAAAIYGAECIGVIMTGMGHDGVAGCRDVRAGGGYVLGQDAATSDVYGMNKAAFVAGHVDEQFALDQLPNLLQASTCSIRRRNTSVQRQPPQSQISGD